MSEGKTPIQTEQRQNMIEQERSHRARERERQESQASRNVDRQINYEPKYAHIICMKQCIYVVAKELIDGTSVRWREKNASERNVRRKEKREREPVYAWIEDECAGDTPKITERQKKGTPIEFWTRKNETARHIKRRMKINEKWETINMRLSCMFSYLLLRTTRCTGARTHTLAGSRNEDDNIHDRRKMCKTQIAATAIDCAVCLWRFLRGKWFIFFRIRVSFRSLKFTFFFSDPMNFNCFLVSNHFSFASFVCAFFFRFRCIRLLLCCAFLPVRKLNTRWSISNISRTKSNDTKTETILFAFFCSAFSRDCCWRIWRCFFSLRYFHQIFHVFSPRRWLNSCSG